MIAKATNEHLSHVSRALRELQTKGLVECKNPKNSKYRFYEITAKGREIYSRVAEIEGKGTKSGS
jgi:DNA-binding MarR family transcriptional regulator